jgi:hypothetical protein
VTGPTGPGSLVAAQNIYYVAKGGADTNLGTSYSPWLTVTRAISSIAASSSTGATINIGPGSYNESISTLGNKNVILLGTALDTTAANTTLNGNHTINTTGSTANNNTIAFRNLVLTGTSSILNMVGSGAGTLILDKVELADSGSGNAGNYITVTGGFQLKMNNVTSQNTALNFQKPLISLSSCTATIQYCNFNSISSTPMIQVTGAYNPLTVANTSLTCTSASTIGAGLVYMANTLIPGTFNTLAQVSIIATTTGATATPAATLDANGTLTFLSGCFFLVRTGSSATTNAVEGSGVGTTPTTVVFNNNTSLYGGANQIVRNVPYFTATAAAIDTFTTTGTGGTGPFLIQNPDNNLFYTNSKLQIAVSSATQQIQAGADFVPKTHLAYNLGQSGMAWNSIFVGPGSLHIGDATISATGTNIVIQGNIQPQSSNAQTLGSTGLPWKEIYMGPGTLNIIGPSGANATIGSDQNGIAYAQQGFATPFINIGPSISAINDPGAIGGWVLGPTGTIGSNDYDLIAQQKLPGAAVPAGLTGPVYSLIQPRDPMNVSTISTSVLSVTSTATFSYPPISATNPTTSNQLANKAYVDSVKNQYSFGNTLVVDAVNGNDTTASPGGTPYSTITKAVADLVAGDNIWVLPGTYNITSSILLPANTSMRGANITTTKIQMLNAGAQSTMFTMNTSTRVEDLGLTMTAVSGNSNVTMFYFPGQTCQTAKLKSLTATLDTTGVVAGSGNVTAIYSDGSNAQTNATFSWTATIVCTFNVYSQNTGQVAGVLLSNSPAMTLRETNINVSSATATASGILTTGTSLALLRSCAIQGGVNDLKQVGGTIQLGTGTDLINRTAGGYPFTTFQTPLDVFYGVIGDIFKNRGVTSGWIWPGSVNAQQADAGKHIPVYPDELPSYYTVLQSTIVYGFQTTLRGSPGTGASTIVQLYKNDVAVPSYIIGYGYNESTIKTNYASTFTIGVTDRLSWYISSSVSNPNNNDSHDFTMNLKLY